MIKILLAVDGSESALRAARQLVTTASWLKHPPAVHLVAVHRPVPMANRAASVVGKDAIESYYRDETQAALQGAREILRLAGLACTEHVVIDEPAAGIETVAREQGCDLIYMGTRGLGAVKSLVLGSTAQKVLHLAKVPVVLVH
jgi:nucleotide-binding universal stress UspA family protein